MEKYHEKIKTYLDNVFASLPNDEATMRMKNDMYCSMLDKFNGLVQGGASEDEAFGKVIGEFGSLDEIRAALGITAQPTAAEAIPVSAEIKKQYKNYKIIQGILIAIGVVFCIVAVFMYGLYENFFGEGMASAIFGLLVAAGVFLFVFSGTSEEIYFDVIKPVRYAIPPSSERVNQYRKFLVIRAFLISLAVFLFITGVFVTSFLDDNFGMTIIMPIMIAIGVAILIIVGAVHDTYKDIRGK